ncbi:hypothetical protein DM466_09595 [Lactobacillus helveticus]|nr:hypothetical protein DM466_09595 [Lactobacillus helveticus]
MSSCEYIHYYNHDRIKGIN